MEAQKASEALSFKKNNPFMWKEGCIKGYFLNFILWKFQRKSNERAEWLQISSFFFFFLLKNSFLVFLAQKWEKIKHQKQNKGRTIKSVSPICPIDLQNHTICASLILRHASRLPLGMAMADPQFWSRLKYGMDTL